MSYSKCLIAGRNGKTLEVEQVDLFDLSIGEMDFSIAIHAASVIASAPESRPLVVSLYKTGCKIANLSVSGTAAVLYGNIKSLGQDRLRSMAQASIESVATEIGCERLAQLLKNSLTDQTHLNA